MKKNNSFLNTYSKYIKYWSIDTNYIFLNHGSFGATPIEILKKQQIIRNQLENEPVKFFIRDIEEQLFLSKKKLAKFINANDKDIVFIPNATYGVNAVLKSLIFREGDELLTTNHEYHSCKNTLELVAKRNNSKVVVAEIPFPLKSENEIIEILLKYVTKKTRLLLIDHITSPTGLVFPVEKITNEFESRGIDVLVDGAHAAGMVDLKINKFKPSYYTGNCHKWLCTPKGSAFLYVREDKQKNIYPLITTYSDPPVERGKWTVFQNRFYWLGTIDVSPFICVGHTIDYLNNLYPNGLKGIIKHNHNLAIQARNVLSKALINDFTLPDKMIGSLVSLPLPDTKRKTFPNFYIDDLQNILFYDYNIEVPIMFFPKPPKRVIRVSAQIYNSLKQYEILKDILCDIL